ncbi:unnamed protein product [Pedinophyceae sp. YPF-701]|nr:unnamed protein product [Pedinophyceae sp. YPF-701]
MGTGKCIVTYRGLRTAFAMKVAVWVLFAAVISTLASLGQAASPVVEQCKSVVSETRDYETNPGKVFSSKKVTWTHQERLAVVIPMAPAQVSRYETLMRSFQEVSPCDEKVPEIDFVIAISGEGSDKVDQSALLKWEVIERCFGKGFVYVIDIPPQFDDRTTASTYVFWHLFDAFEEMGYGHSFQIEPDVTPVRPGWVHALKDKMEKNACCGDFWQSGSVSVCSPTYGDIANRQDFHVNGNAMYCVGDPAFAEFRDRTRLYYHEEKINLSVAGAATGNTHEDGFDHAMYRFRTHPDNYEYGSRVLDKFHVDFLLLNRCEEEFNPGEVRAQHLDTYLVHSKWHFLSPVEQFVRKTFQTTFGVAPISWELAKIVDMVRSAWEAGLPFPKSKLGDEVCRRDKFDIAPERHEQLCKWETRFGDRVYLWNVDLHAGPIACNMDLFYDIGVEVHAENDFGNCISFNTCKDRLKVLQFDDWRGFSLDPDPEKLRRDFFEAYRDDPEMQRVDMVICSHPAANCELFLPLNKPMIIYPTTRLEFGRNDEVVEWRKPYISDNSPRRWKQWVANIQTMAEDPKHIFAANNLFDAAYLQYHTGVKALTLPSWCGSHIKAKWDPDLRLPILIGPYRDNLDFPQFRKDETWAHPIMEGLKHALDAHNAKSSGSARVMERIRDLYDTFDWARIAKHPCMIWIPYQLSVMSFFEAYRTGIPVFAPARALLREWHAKHDLTWERIYGYPERLDESWDLPYSPNSEDDESFSFWLEYADFYQMPHVQLFESWDHLMELLDTVDLQRVHDDMMAYSERLYSSLKMAWKTHINAALAHAPNRHDVPREYQRFEDDAAHKAAMETWERGAKTHFACPEAAERSCPGMKSPTYFQEADRVPDADEDEDGDSRRGRAVLRLARRVLVRCFRRRRGSHRAA